MYIEHYICVLCKQIHMHCKRTHTHTHARTLIYRIISFLLCILGLFLIVFFFHTHILFCLFVCPSFLCIFVVRLQFGLTKKQKKKTREENQMKSGALFQSQFSSLHTSNKHTHTNAHSHAQRRLAR